jgi:hypothetical protein
MAMKKYFFDLATPKACFYDYQGQALAELQEARRVAQLVAHDLETTGAFDWAGAAVNVRDVFGKTLFSVEVQQQLLAA